MISTTYIALMAAYTAWQNDAIYAAAGTLTEAARRADRGAFFGSIHATLSHVLWGDQLWLHRLAGTPAPAAPDIPGSVATHATWNALCTDRQATDHAILAWARRITPTDLEGDYEWYSGAIQAPVRRPRWVLTVQLFNHGSHHRGQVHAMLTAAGVRPTDTDIPFMESTTFPW